MMGITHDKLRVTDSAHTRSNPPTGDASFRISDGKIDIKTSNYTILHGRDYGNRNPPFDDTPVEHKSGWELIFPWILGGLAAVVVPTAGLSAAATVSGLLAGLAALSSVKVRKKGKNILRDNYHSKLLRGVIVGVEKASGIGVFGRGYGKPWNAEVADAQSLLIERINAIADAAVLKMSAGRYYEECIYGSEMPIRNAVQQMYCRIETTEISTEKDQKFVDFTKWDSQWKDYGGQQAWYEKRYNGSTKKKRKRMRSSGCGPIAAANIIAYYAQTDHNKIGHLLYWGSATPEAMSAYEYIDMSVDIYNRYVMQTIGIGKPDGFRWSLPLGVWNMWEVTGGIIAYARDKKVKLYSQYANNKTHNFEQAIEFIKRGLIKDCPVIISILINGVAENLGIDRHYMTITKIDVIYAGTKTTTVSEVSTTETLVDAKITVSNWGKRYEYQLKKMWEYWNPFQDMWGYNIALAYLQI